MTLIGTFVAAAALSFGLASPGHGTESVPIDSPGKAPTPELTVKGDVLMIEGEFYTVRDSTGHQVRLHVNKETKSDGRFKVGDKIEAMATPEGHARSITLVVPPSEAAPLLPNTGPASPPSLLGGNVVQ